MMDDTLKEIRDLLYEINTKVNKYISKDENDIKNRVLIDSDKSTVTVEKYTRNITERECTILFELINAKNNFCTYDYLCKKVYGYDIDESSTISLRTIISRLRQKTNGLITIKSIRNKGIKITNVFREKKEE